MPTHNHGAAPGEPIQPQTGMQAPHLLMLLLLGVLAWQTIHYFPQLPGRVASHFDGRGNPNGYQSRAFFFWLMWSVVLLMLFAFVGIPRLVGRMNPDLLNIPNKHYWLGADRVGQMKRILNREMGWYGVVVIGFIVFVMQLVLQANMARAPLSSPLMWSGLGAFIVFTILWTIRFYRKLAIPKS